jgi:hypothetical protein
MIRQGVADGEFKAVDPVLAHFIISGACEALLNSPHILSASCGVEEVSVDLKQRYVKAVVELILTGMIEGRSSKA